LIHVNSLGPRTMYVSFVQFNVHAGRGLPDTRMRTQSQRVMHTKPSDKPTIARGHGEACDAPYRLRFKLSDVD
jgi:hypothetical protein